MFEKKINILLLFLFLDFFFLSLKVLFLYMIFFLLFMKKTRKHLKK